ncbi:MAG TPA: alginate lyase family protein [Mycobacteriales bacterium]|nr:alginate lyase family protein [Mycobacteriales bacterium]
MIDDLGRDLAVARAAKAGRFSHCGVALDLGRRPDWIGGGLGDPEWRIEWVKLYEGLDLAYACVATGDGGFLTAWEDLVESFCYQVPVGHDTSDVSARRIQNWLYAWQRFAADPDFAGLRPGLAELLVSRLRADVAHLEAHLTPERNHRTLELYALLLAGLALDEDMVARRALNRLAANADTDIWADGVHRECSTDYHLIVLRSLLGAIANARRFDLEVPPELLAAAGRACDFALHVQRPDGLTPALSDGDQGDFRAVLLLGADLLERADLRWAATAGTAGSVPADTGADFPVGGYFIQRSGWGDGDRAYADERWLILDAGPLGDGGHGHYDQLSVEIAAGGRLLVADPGRYTYDAEYGTLDGAPGWRHWFKGTAAHNTVCVDGLDQTPYRPGKPAKGKPTSTARLLDRWTTAGLDLLRAEVTSPCYDAVHTRTVAFVDDDYWIVHDRLRAATPHTYEARWHLAPTAAGAVELEPDRLAAPGLQLLTPLGELSVTDGWISASYGRKQPAPVAVLAAAGADVDLVTVIVPGGDGPARAEAEVTGDRVEVRVHRPGLGTDTVHWSLAGSDHGWERTC